MANLGDLLAGAAGAPADFRTRINTAAAQAASMNMYRSAETAEAFQRARQVRAEAMASEQKLNAQQNLSASFIKLGFSADVSDGLAGASLAGINPEALEKAMSEDQWRELEHTAQDQTASPQARTVASNVLYASGRWKPDFIQDKGGNNVDFSHTDPLNPQPTSTLNPQGSAALTNADAHMITAKRPGTITMNPQQIDQRATLIANGQLPMPTQYEFTRNPAQAGAIIDAVLQKNPQASSMMQPVMQATYKDFAGGGQNGKRLQGYRTVEAHLDQLDQLADALKNGDNQTVNAIANSVAAWSGDAAPTNAKLLPQFVAAETMRALSNNGIGTGEERDRLQQSMSLTKFSPEQYEGAASTLRNALNGGIESLRRSYDAGTFGRGGQGFLPSFDDVYHGTVASQPMLPKSTPVGPPAGGAEPPAGAAPSSVAVSPSAPPAGGPSHPHGPAAPSASTTPAAPESLLDQAMRQYRLGSPQAVSQVAPPNSGVQQ